VSQPSDVEPGDHIFPPVTVEAVDGSGNRVTSFTNRIDIELIPSSITLGGRKQDDPDDGLATFDNLSISVPGQGYRLRATATGVAPDTSAAFDVLDADAAVRLEFGQHPTGAAAGAVISPAVTVGAVRGDGATDTGFTGNVTVAIASGPTSQIFGTTTRAAANGSVTFNDLSIRLVGAYTLQATASGLTPDTSAAFTITPGPASGATSQVTASPTSIPANGSSTSAISVQIKDAFGNNRTTGGDTVTLSRSPALGTLSGVTDNGNGSYTATLTSGTTPGTVTISGTVNGVGITDTAMVTLTASAASKLEFGQQPTNEAAGAVISPAVTVRAVAFGITNPAFTGAVTLSILTGPQGGELLGTTTRNTVSGVATFNDLSIELAGTYTLLAASSGVAPDTSAAFAITPGPPSGATSEITSDPASIPADGSSTSTITVTLRDAFANRLTTGGNLVVLSTDRGTLGQVSDRGDGTYTASLTSSTTAGTATVTGTVGGAGIVDTATVGFTQAGTPTLVVDVQPVSTPIDQPITPAVVVRATDGLGNTLVDFTGSVTASLVSNPTGASLSGSLVRPFQNGLARFEDLRIDRAGSGYRLGFSSPGIQGATSAPFAVTGGTASPTNSTITADPVAIPADGTSISTITVRLIDASGAPLTSGGDRVTMSATRGILGQVTDRGDGTYTATLRSTATPGTATISGTVNGATIIDTATVSFAAGSADLEVEVSVSDTSPTVGDEVAYVVTARNRGPDTATGIRLVQEIPIRLTFASATTSKGDYDPTTALWTVGSLAPDERATLTLVLTVRDEESD
jgi:adhesin/invasin